MKPTVTAVGRLLKPKGDEPRLYHVIKVQTDGAIKTVIKRPV